jgi:hypothetical protein
VRNLLSADPICMCGFCCAFLLILFYFSLIYGRALVLESAGLYEKGTGVRRRELIDLSLVGWLAGCDLLINRSGWRCAKRKYYLSSLACWEWADRNWD